ncbi:hypothetical protein DO62_3803 [Burkholderia pseudomallei]|nr:hypothetical protein DO62_3803 [Burkholderia pseudomallei]
MIKYTSTILTASTQKSFYSFLSLYLTKNNQDRCDHTPRPSGRLLARTLYLSRLI